MVENLTAKCLDWEEKYAAVSEEKDDLEKLYVLNEELQGIVQHRQFYSRMFCYREFVIVHIEGNVTLVARMNRDSTENIFDIFLNCVILPCVRTRDHTTHKNPYRGLGVI